MENTLRVFAFRPSLSLSFSCCIAERRGLRVQQRGEAEDGWARARERAMRRRACPAVEKEGTKNVRWLPLPLSSARKKRVRRSFACEARFSGQEPHQAPIRRRQRGPRGRGRYHERRKEGEKRGGIHSVVDPLTQSDGKHFNLSFLSLRSNKTTQKLVLTRPPAVPDWRVPRRPPLRKVEKRRRGGGG